MVHDGKIEEVREHMDKLCAANIVFSAPAAPRSHVAGGR
jgi:hypothetical protein